MEIAALPLPSVSRLRLVWSLAMTAFLNGGRPELLLLGGAGAADEELVLAPGAVYVGETGALHGF